MNFPFPLTLVELCHDCVYVLLNVVAVSMYNSCLNFVENLFGRDKKQVRNENQGRCNIYHERQVKELCALHALNNLFQDRNAFNKQTLDNICHSVRNVMVLQSSGKVCSLSPDNLVNPHKSMLGLGNYDVNVLMSALQQKGYEAIWFDKRKDPASIDFTKIVGLILNIPSEMKFLPLRLNRKHWIAIKEIGNTFYNLDSKLDHPHAIGKEAELVVYLREQIRSKDREIFVVVSQEIERDSLWRKDSRHVEALRVPVTTTAPATHTPVNSTSAVIHPNSANHKRVHKHSKGVVYSAVSENCVKSDSP